MENLKKYLIKDADEEIKDKEVEIENSNKELKVLEARLKVEKKFLKMEDIPKEIKEDIQYSVEAIGSMTQMEKDKNDELKKELEILQYRKKVINKFEEGEL